MRKPLIYILALLPLLTMCRPQSSSTSTTAFPVEVKTMDSLQTSCTHTYAARTADADVVVLSFPIPGTITQVLVHNGQEVSAGQALLALDNTTSHSLLTTAEAKLKQAQDGYARAKRVYDEGGVSELKMKEITTQLTEAEQLVRGAQGQVENCVLRAPMAGVVGNLNKYVGQNVLPNLPILTLHNRQGIKMVYAVPEQDIVKVQIGDRITARIPALGNQQWSGHVMERSLTPHPLAHNYEVRAILEGDTQSILPGMSGSVQSQRDFVQGLMVPSHCIQTYGKGISVWVCRDSVAERVMVEAASFGRDGVMITKGLQVGDQVIVRGYQKVYNGMKISAHEVQE